jgi:hypothetical protein
MRFGIKSFIFRFLIVLALGGLAVMLLWNGLMSDIFSLGKVSYWQGLGLLVLGRILFGGHHFGHMGFRGSHGDLAKAWNRLTPEDKQAMFEHHRWGGHGHHHFGRSRFFHQPGHSDVNSSEKPPEASPSAGSPSSQAVGQDLTGAATDYNSKGSTDEESK